MTTLQQLATSQSGLPTRINENFASVSPAALFGMNPQTTNGLTWGYYGGVVNNAGTLTTIADGTVTLTNSATNYVEATSAGIVQVNTSGFTSGNIPLYQIVVSGSLPTTISDMRVSGMANIAAASGGFSIDYANPGTGNLTLLGSTVATGAAPGYVESSPTGRYVYTANGFGNSISQFAVGADGTLSTITTAIGAFSNPVYLDTDLLERWLYAACNTSNDIAQFTIGTNGALTSIGANVAAGNGVAAVKVHPNGKFLYAVNTSANTLQYYSINQTTGAITSIGTIATGTNPTDLDIDPTGKYLVVSNKTGGTNIGSVSSYILTNGVPTANGSAISVTSNAFGIKFHPNSQHVYVANVDTLNTGSLAISIDIFPCNTSTGVLGTKSNFSLSGTSNNQGLTLDIDRLGRYLAIANPYNGNARTARIAQNGSLTINSVISGNGSGIAFEASLRFAYSASSGSNVIQRYIVDDFRAGSGGFYGSVYIGGEIHDSGERLALMSNTAPTIGSGFGTSPTITANNTSAFKIVIGSGGTASSGVINLPAAPNGWIAEANDLTNPLFITKQTGESTTSVTLTNYTITTMVATAWGAADELHVVCKPY